MVKRSIEQEIRNKYFGIRNGNYEKNAVVKNQGTKQRGQRTLGYCWLWAEREMRREPEVLEARVPVEECLDCPATITSKELAPIHSVKMASSRMLVLQDREWLQIWGKVLVCTSSG